MKKKKQGPPPVPLPEPQQTNGRTIFVAKPAYDMRDAYDRVVREMLRRGYTVAPDPVVDIPYGPTATKFVDEKLAAAEASIHLLGERSGYVPEDAEAIVKLQLKSAGARIGQLSTGTAGQGNAFCRLIWAPELPESGSEPEHAWPERNPMAALNKFDSYRESDNIAGGSLSKFVDFLVQYLDRPARAPIDPENETPVNSSSRIYVYHRRDDRSYARSIRKALSDRKVILPAVEGEDAERLMLHRQELAGCDMVVLCWGIASDAWTMSTLNELKDWRALGRTKNFERRGLVVGPPQGEAKSDFVDLPLPDEIDVIVDQRANDPPSPADLIKLFSPRNP